jgi:hypothetical protein
MTYNFPQFKVEIIDPTISVNLDSIQDKAISKLLSVDVILTTESSSFGVTALDMPYQDTWEDDEVYDMVLNWLTQFEA